MGIIICVTIAIIAFSLAIILGGGLLPASKNDIQKKAKSAALEYCTTHNYGEEWCNRMKLINISEPLDYGPTDGADEYIGTWFVDFSTSEDEEKFIYVVLDPSGNIDYINNTGEWEYPLCRDDYKPGDENCTE